MLKEIFHDSFEDFEIYRVFIEYHASVTGWQKLFSHTMLLTFGGRCNCYFWDIRLKILRLPKFTGYLILICSWDLVQVDLSQVLNKLQRGCTATERVTKPRGRFVSPEWIWIILKIHAWKNEWKNELTNGGGGFYSFSSIMDKSLGTLLHFWCVFQFTQVHPLP